MRNKILHLFDERKGPLYVYRLLVQYLLLLLMFYRYKETILSISWRRIVFKTLLYFMSRTTCKGRLETGRLSKMKMKAPMEFSHTILRVGDQMAEVSEDFTHCFNNKCFPISWTEKHFVAFSK